MELIIFLAGSIFAGVIGYAIACQKFMEERRKEIIDSILEDCGKIKEQIKDIEDFMKKVQEIKGDIDGTL